jgi:hypothetical protein
MPVISLLGLVSALIPLLTSTGLQVIAMFWNLALALFDHHAGWWDEFVNDDDRRP